MRHYRLPKTSELSLQRDESRLIVGITLVVELLNVGVRAQVTLDDGGVDEPLVVALTHGTDAQEEVVEVGRGDDQAVESETYAGAFGLDIVVDIGGAEEGVVVDLQAVEFVECLSPFLAHLRGVGGGEDEADVVDEVVDLVATDTVVHFHALHDVVVHLVAHLLVGRLGEEGDDQQHNNDGCEDDELAEAAVKEHLTD